MALTILFSAAPAYAVSRARMDVVVLLDNSGSMHREGKTPGNDERFMRVAAVQYLLEKMAPGDRAALVTFDSVVHLDPAASHLRNISAPGVEAAFDNGVRRIAASPGGSTNMGAGLRAAARILRQESAAGRQRFIILLTDGTPNPPHGANTPTAIIQYARALGKSGIVIHTVGLGDLSSNPAEAAAARSLLESIAREGGGAAHQAANAEALPALFGSIFAQLVGHEVSRPLASGQQATFTLAPGSQNLRVIAVSEGTPPQFILTDPRGKTVPVRNIAPLLPGVESARLAVAAVNSPGAGSWTVRAVQGAVEVAYEPDFEAVLLRPRHNSRVPADAPLSIVVEVRRKGGSLPLALSKGRVTLEYEQTPGQPPVTLNLTEDSQQRGRFSGTLPDTGAVGSHNIIVRCFRSGANGAEEGGPAYASLQVARIPVLKLIEPQPCAFYTLPAPVAVQAALSLAGARVSRAISGIRITASVTVSGRAAPQVELAPAGGGVYAGGSPSGRQAGAAALRVVLSGSYQGQSFDPQELDLPLTLTPHPIVEMTGGQLSRQAVNPDDSRTITERIRSSAPTAQIIRLTASGVPGVTVDPSSIDVPAHGEQQSVKVILSWRHAPPGDYSLDLKPALAGTGVDLHANQVHSDIHVRTWLERNGWWFYPGTGLLVLLILAAVALILHLTREQARRQRKMRDMLNGAALYVPGTAQPFRPAPQNVLVRRSYTFGGEGADVFIPDPAEPGQPLFKEPRLKIAVEWDKRHRQPLLMVTPEGTDTILYDKDNKLIGEPIVPTEGGAFFYVDPEHRLVRVNSEWNA